MAPAKCQPGRLLECSHLSPAGDSIIPISMTAAGIHLDDLQTVPHCSQSPEQRGPSLLPTWELSRLCTFDIGCPCLATTEETCPAQALGAPTLGHTCLMLTHFPASQNHQLHTVYQGDLFTQAILQDWKRKTFQLIHRITHRNSNKMRQECVPKAEQEKLKKKKT